MCTLVELLAQSVARRPQAEALVQVPRRVSYGGLWQAVTIVAARLRAEGLQPGDRVCLLLEASPEYVAAYYGTLAAGGVVVALNTTAKWREIAGCVRHCGARFLIADDHSELAAVQPEDLASCRLLTGLDVWAPPPGVPELPVPPDRPDALAAILYTSGTTGMPKGVMLSHRNLVSNVLAVVDYLRLTPADRVLHALPFHYSYGNSVLHTHLAAGATVVIENSLVYPHRLLERMAEERVTGFSGVPASYALLLSRTQLDRYPLPDLRYLTQAGGPMAPVDIVRVRRLLPQAEFFVMYGQTEATSRLTYLPPERLPGRLGSVGRPIADTEIQVLDSEAKPLARGELGQVCVRGPGVMLGYWNDPEATQRVLRDGWLWTGDIGRLDSEGYLYIHGRSSEMIKVGAHRVSPTEIEEVLLTLEGVAEAAVTGLPDPLLGQVLRAWLVPQPGVRLSAREVLAHCRRCLPAYKVPKRLEFVDGLPKTASGKIRRLALAELEQSAEQGGWAG